MAIKAQAPIVPVAVTGGRAAMRKGSAIVRPVHVSVRVGEPIETAGLTLDDRDRLDRDACGHEVRARCSGIRAHGTVMELLATLGRTLGFSFAAGINLYATVAILGLASRFGWVAPARRSSRSSTTTGSSASRVVLYVVEFFADKIPWVDSLVGRGAHGHPPARRRVHRRGHARRRVARDARRWSALLGGTVAASSHLTKAGTRVVANASPEPFTNWLLSLGEDVFVVGLGYLALQHPVAALVVASVLLVLIALVCGCDHPNRSPLVRPPSGPDVTDRRP